MGTSPIARPARRSGASASRSSATVRTVLMPAPPPRARACARPARRRGRAARAPPRRRRARWAATVGLVAARDRARERPLGAERRDVLDRAAHAAAASSSPRLVRLEARAGGDPLGRRLERDQEVGGHRGRGVVGGAALVVDLERRHAEPRARSAAKASASGVEPATAQPAPVEARGRSVGRERLERVQAEGGGARGRERGQRGGAARVPDQRGGAGDRGRRGRDLARRARTARSRRSRPAPRRGRAGPSTVDAGLAQSARASAVPRRPAPTTPTRAALSNVSVSGVILRPVHSALWG